MKNIFKLACVALLVFGAVSCAKVSDMAKEAAMVETSCTPEILECVADNIAATYTLKFPEGYFHPKAILEVSPVLVYEGGETVLPSIKIQGEKINDNYKVVPLEGGSVGHTVSYAYVPGVEKSHLELRCTAWDGEKAYPFPVAYKVADGTNCTYKLVCMEGCPVIAPDKYQAIINETEEAQILYNINSAEVRHSELTKAEIKAFQKFLADLKKDERRTVTFTNILAYASPDGPESLNNKLSEKRSVSAEKAYERVTKKNRPNGQLNVTTVGEDWEGFQELVNASSVQDKELILRVLSMYADPAVREREIKNMSAVYTTLAKKILPQLRRARFITNIDFKNYTDEEIKDMIARDNVEALDEEGLLYAATLADKAATKANLYKMAAEKFNSERGLINQAVCLLNAGKNDDAAAILSKCNRECLYVKANLAVVALRKGALEQAAKYLEGTELAEGLSTAAVLDILSGNYESAAKKLEGQNGHNAALANLLVGKLDRAQEAHACKCAKAAYVRAVVAARQGKASEVAKQLDIVKEKSPKLAARAANDIEFAKYR